MDANGKNFQSQKKTRVEDIAKDDVQHIMESGPTFEWTPEIPIADNDEDMEYINAEIYDSKYYDISL